MGGAFVDKAAHEGALEAALPPPGRGFTLDEYVCALFDLTQGRPDRGVAATRSRGNVRG